MRLRASTTHARFVLREGALSRTPDVIQLLRTVTTLTQLARKAGNNEVAHVAERVRMQLRAAEAGSPLTTERLLSLEAQIDRAFEPQPGHA